jgi:hypothetical protein
MRKLGWLALLVWSGVNATSLTLYDDALRSSFADASWANSGDYNLANTTPKYGASGDSIKFVARNWGGLQFVANGVEYNLADYQSLTFYINGGSAGGQSLQLYVCDNYNAVSGVYALTSLVAGGVIPANSWVQATLDFDTAQLTYGTFNCLVIMDASGNSDAAGQPAAYVDQIVFNQRTGPLPSGGTVNVTVDASSNVHPISPQIFGVAFGDAARNQQMGYTVDRWGGNSTSRYNWQGPAHNTGNDYFFLGYGSDQTDDADAFVTNAVNAGIAPLIAVPTIGWVEKFDALNPTTVQWGFSQAKYGPQTLDECRFYAPTPPPWCHGDAGNGFCDGSVNTTAFCQNGEIVGNDPTDTSVPNAPANDAAWVAHLQPLGVHLYSLDNEVMLWNSTHRDVHPNPLSYDTAWTETVDYATAIKNQDATALVTGPVTWGYPDLFTSAFDTANCNCSDGTDRQTHGDLPFVAWYLQQVCTNPLAGGKHLVDYLDLHWYPQDPNGASGSIYSNDQDATTTGRRLRSLKELYDPTWVSESWFADLGDFDANHYDKPGLIPRVKAWINQYCPGTKLAITEYAWDQDTTFSGAVAQAEALAIFAREGVDMATRWVAPAASSLAERGFEIFLNYDGAGAKVQGDSIKATTSSIDQVGAYAFHLGSQRTMVLLTNKDSLSHDVALTFNTAQSGTWTLYGFDSTTAMHQIGSGPIAGVGLTLTGLPPMSASLLVIPEGNEIFADGFQ